MVEKENIRTCCQQCFWGYLLFAFLFSMTFWLLISLQFHLLSACSHVCLASVSFDRWLLETILITGLLQKTLEMGEECMHLTLNLLWALCTESSSWSSVFESPWQFFFKCVSLGGWPMPYPNAVCAWWELSNCRWWNEKLRRMQILMLIFSSKNGISAVLWTAERWTKGRMEGKGAWGKDVQGKWLLFSLRRSDGQMSFRVERPSSQSLTWMAWWFMAPPGLSWNTHQTDMCSLLEWARGIYWAGGQSYSSSLCWYGKKEVRSWCEAAAACYISFPNLGITLAPSY